MLGPSAGFLIGVQSRDGKAPAWRWSRSAELCGHYPRDNSGAGRLDRRRSRWQFL